MPGRISLFYAAQFLRLAAEVIWPAIAPNRAEHLLIHRIQSHTNPKRRKGFLKQAGQKSVKEELPKQRKGPKRAVEYQLKVQTHIWEHDAVGSNPATPTKALWNRWFQRAFLVPRNGWDCLCPPQARAGTPSTEGAIPRDKPAQQYLKRRPRVRAAFQNPDRSTPRRTRAMPARIQGRKIIGNRRIALWFS